MTPKRFTIAVHQPYYLPYLGYFHKIAHSDIFVFLDDAQYSNEGMHNWNSIKTAKGKERIKIPVKQHLGDRINVVPVKDELGWRERHLKAVETAYSSARYFESVFPLYKELLFYGSYKLAELNECIIEEFSGRFGLCTDFVKSSSLKIETKREQRLIDIVTKLNGTEYYSGTGAKVYQDENSFLDAGIKLVYSDFRPVKYEQLHGEFEKNLSVLDYVMNCGFNPEIFDLKVE